VTPALGNRFGNLLGVRHWPTQLHLSAGTPIPVSPWNFLAVNPRTRGSRRSGHNERLHEWFRARAASSSS
jgi:hypothetical protein